MPRKMSPVRIAMLAALLTAASVAAFGQTQGTLEFRWKKEHLAHGRPIAPREGTTLILREGYALLHDNARRIPIWTAYRLDLEDIVRDIPRSDDYREDPILPGERAKLEDYKGSGYSRGHMAPAEDMKRSEKVMSESFYLSNMAPQNPELNSGEWNELEKQIRKWLPARRQLWIYTGPAFDLNKPLEPIGDGVAVPTHFWKIVVDEREDGTISTIAFLMPNRSKTGKFYESQTTVDAIELATGIDFLPGLPEEIEESAESKVVLSHWRESGVAASPVSIAPRIAPRRSAPRVTPRDPARGAAPRGRAETVRKRLKRGDQFVFKSIRIRLARVDEEDPDDQKDDSVELGVITGTRSVVLRVTELETIFFEEYEITVDDVRPRGSPNRGEGTAYVLVRYYPGIR